MYYIYLKNDAKFDDIRRLGWGAGGVQSEHKQLPGIGVKKK